MIAKIVWGCILLVLGIGVMIVGPIASHSANPIAHTVLFSFKSTGFVLIGAPVACCGLVLIAVGMRRTRSQGAILCGDPRGGKVIPDNQKRAIALAVELLSGETDASCLSDADWYLLLLAATENYIRLRPVLGWDEIERQSEKV